MSNYKHLIINASISVFIAVLCIFKFYVNNQYPQFKNFMTLLRNKRGYQTVKQIEDKQFKLFPLKELKIYPSLYKYQFGVPRTK